MCCEGLAVIVWGCLAAASAGRALCDDPRPGNSTSIPSNAADVPESDRQAGTVRTFNAELNLQLVWCPAGSFQMGSPDSDEGIDEKPRHTVRLTRGFWLGQTEVTQGQWKAVMGREPWKGQEFAMEGADYPATFVSWEEMQEFCRKLTEQERQAGRLGANEMYTLPTEAQWEYACRAGTTTTYSFGDDDAVLNEHAWWGGGFSGIGNAKEERHPHPVKTKLANPWGLYDMHGNVWEWCADWYGGGYYPKSPQSDPSGPAEGSIRVGRGGGWDDPAWGCRSAYRDAADPSIRMKSLGFRLAIVTSGQ